MAWLEFESSANARVRLRRFDATSAPVGATLDVSPAGNIKVAQADIDLVSASPGEYGVAMALAGDRQFFTHVICTGN